VCHTENDGGSLTATLGGGIGGGSLSGSPPVFRFFVAQPPGAYGLSASSFASQVQLTFAQTLTSSSCASNPAQRAIQAALPEGSRPLDRSCHARSWQPRGRAAGPGVCRCDAVRGASRGHPPRLA
jgi:hypothetical protein